MSIESVVIKTQKQVESMDERILNAIINASKKNVKIPLVYQYLHNPNKQLVIDSDNKIGEVTNIHITDKGDFVGDIILFNILKIANNYQGCIDNIVARFNPETNMAEIIAFIVYDKTAKEDVIKRKSSLVKLPKPGEIPVVSQYGPEMLKEISDTLVDEYKKLVDVQQTVNE